MAWILIVVSVGMSLLLLGFIGWAGSGVSGREFAPTHFQIRSFDLREVPWLGWQVGGVKRTVVINSTSQYLIANKWLNVPKTVPQRWDLVQINHDLGSIDTADPSILTAYLEGHGSHGIDWEQWSKDHPQAAAVLWPLVQQMAIDHLYLLLPQVFDLARQHTDGIELQQSLDDFLASELPSFAEDLQHAGRGPQAIAALQSAIARDPQEAVYRKTLEKLTPPK